MRAKTLIELLTLSSNLYLIAKDKEVMDQLSKLASKGKDKLNNMLEGSEGEEGEENELLCKIVNKAKEAKEELEKRVEEIAVKVYKKMHIAHTDNLKALLVKIETFEKRLNLIEARISNSEGQKKE